MTTPATRPSSSAAVNTSATRAPPSATTRRVRLPNACTWPSTPYVAPAPTIKIEQKGDNRPNSAPERGTGTVVGSHDSAFVTPPQIVVTENANNPNHCFHSRHKRARKREKRGKEVGTRSSGYEQRVSTCCGSMPKEKTGSKQSVGSHAELRASLRTSADIFTRLSHDPDWSAATNRVCIWYWDRLVSGYLETPLQGFTPISEGGDLPWHRVWWFRLRKETEQICSGLKHDSQKGKHSALQTAWAENIDSAIRNVQAIEEERQHLREVKQNEKARKAKGEG